MGRLPRWTLSPIAVGSAFAVLLAALTVGIRVPGLGILGLFPQGRDFDYSSVPYHGFAPLDDAFVRRVLGQGAPATSGDAAAVARSHGSVVAIDDGVRFVDQHSLTNDDPSSARSVPGVPYQAKTNTSAATRSPDEPADCSNVGNTVWYRYTPAHDQELIADTVGTDRAIALGVFTRGSGATSKVECDSDPYGNALVSFPARAGRTYFFQITDLASGGALVFNLEPKGTISPESFNAHGLPGNDSSVGPSVSADGRYIAFESLATNLVPRTDETKCVLRDPGDGTGEAGVNAQYATRACGQIVVHDRKTGRNTLASVSSSGAAGNSWSLQPHVSADGRYVAFVSWATNLVPGDDNEILDVFVHDMKTGRTERVSVSSSGTEAKRPEGDSDNWLLNTARVSMSDDGRYVAFESAANGLVPDDNDGVSDIFVHDRLAKLTTSLTGNRTPPGKRPGSTMPCISRDGRYVAYQSTAIAAVGLSSPATSRSVVVADRVTGTSTVLANPKKTNYPYDGVDTGLYIDDVRTNSHACFSTDDRYIVLTASSQAFVRDLKTGKTRKVSYASDGSSTLVYWPATISGNGRYVAFITDEYSGDATKDYSYTAQGVLVRDLVTGFTEDVTAPLTNNDPTKYRSAAVPDISADGRVIAFEYRMDDFGVGDATIGYLPVRPRDNYIQIYTYERPRPTS